MRLIAVLERFAHHNPETSPDHMVNHVAYDRVFRPAREVAGGRVVRTLDGWVRRRAGMTGYNLNACASELRVWAATRHGRSLVHFFNGDINCRFLPAVKGRRVVLATYHQPPDQFFRFFRKTGHLGHLDGALVTSNVLRPLMTRYLPEDRVLFQPLAVDLERFRPASPKRPKRGRVCLFVGNWLRDFETLRAVVDRMAEVPDVAFRLITPQANWRHFEGCANVTLRSGIPLKEYVEELHAADLAVLPMKSCTSNLAVLETMASGLPIVTSDVGGIRDYVDESFATLIKGPDADAFAHAVLCLLDDDEARAAKGARARAHAEDFAWPRVAERLKGIYRRFGANV